MPEKSPFPPLNLPNTDILTWLFPSHALTTHLPTPLLTRTLSTPTRPDSCPIFQDAADPSVSLNSTQLLSWIRRIGLALRRMGLQKGDVVLVMSTNHIFVPVVYLGAPGFGYIFSGVNPGYGVRETAYQIENTGAKVMFVEPKLLDVAAEAAEKVGFPREKMFLFSDEECECMRGVRDWRELLPSEEVVEREDVRWRALSEEEATNTTAVLNYSSGTTGLPKGVRVSHRNIISNTEQSIYMRSLTTADPNTLRTPLVASDERWLAFLPLYHAFGQLWSIAAAARTRTPTFYLRTFIWTAWLEAVQRHKITHIVTAPPILVNLAKRPETKQYDLGSLRNILCGGAPLSKELQNEVMAKVGSNLSVVQTCGATEATCSHVHVPGLMRDDSGSVGVCDPGVEIRLMDDSEKEVGDGVRGEIWVKGPNIVLGYWKNDKATADSFVKDDQGGWWWKTGDVAIKKEGWFWIVDRKKELIKVKGFQVAPAELEAALLENDDVSDAAVVALHVEHEERPRAYVSLKEHAKGKLTEKEVADWMAERVAKHKRLTGGVVFVEEVPKSPSGKIQRVIMREWAKRDAEKMAGAEPKAKL